MAEKAIHFFQFKYSIMAKKGIKESQQSSQGIAIGTQGNQAGSIPDGVKGPQQNRERQQDKNIPNQERSSAPERKKEERDRSRH